MTIRSASPPSEAARACLEPLSDAALAEILAAIREALDRGDAPRATTEPEVSLQANGLPRLSDGSAFSPRGPLDFAGVLDPPWDDKEARRIHVKLQLEADGTQGAGVR
ncbi:hypothetical protein RSD66_08720 [Brevundimonas sp. S1H14]|uniref:hypothetical protein n=1 Tax=Brevundimonas sp. S1H14 TaxID=3078084 RepID=UPI0039E7928C